MPATEAKEDKFDLSRDRDLIFVSYSHKDKRWLEHFLIFLDPYFGSELLTVWSDREIRAGYTWLAAIEQAIARARFAVLLVSPNFLASTFIKEKELPLLFAAAEQQNCAPLPVLVSACGYRRTRISEYQFVHDPSRPLDDLDKPKRHRTWVEICDKIRREAEVVWGTDFERLFSAPPAPPLASVEALAETERLGSLHGVPEQKPNFLAREELETLIEALLASTTPAVGVTGKALGLHGMGGIGKTELAVALCHDARVRRAFPDGLYWLTLGQRPDPLRLLTELATLAGEVPASFTGLVQAQEMLRERFKDQACLLVIDDLWRLGDACDPRRPRSVGPDADHNPRRGLAQCARRRGGPA